MVLRVGGELGAVVHRLDGTQAACCGNAGRCDVQATCRAEVDCAGEEHAGGAGDSGWETGIVEAAADWGALEHDEGTIAGGVIEVSSYEGLQRYAGGL